MFGTPDDKVNISNNISSIRIKLIGHNERWSTDVYGMVCTVYGYGIQYVTQRLGVRMPSVFLPGILPMKIILYPDFDSFSCFVKKDDM